MTNPTHFIEVFKSGDRIMNGLLSEIKHKNRNLKITEESKSLKTIAIWKIKSNGKPIPTRPQSQDAGN